MTDLPDGRTAGWITESGEPAPTQVRPIDSRTSVREALARLRKGEHLLWTGDFVNARHYLRSLRKRMAPRRSGAPDTPLQAWQATRRHTREVATTLSRLLVALEADGSLALKRAPDTHGAVTHAWGPADAPRLLPLRTLLGAMTAYSWHERGLEVPGLEGRLVPAYGVFSPTRHVYVQLLRHLDVQGHRVLDVGCGTGVLAFVLLQAGARQAVGTDIDPRAVACARHNAEQLGLSDRFEALQADLLPEGERFDTVVFNAPWVPEVPRTRLDRAVFDAGGATLDRFLERLPSALTPDGRGVLLISDLPERLGLWKPGDLQRRIEAAGLQVERLEQAPAVHGKARTKKGDDPLFPLRRKEKVQLWVLRMVQP